MKTAIAFLLLLLFQLMGFAAGQQSDWKVYSWASSGLYQPDYAPGAGGDVATFGFPIIKHNTAYPAFLTTTADGSLLGDLTGRTISCTLDLGVTGAPLFRFGGEGVWNNCPVPANTRLFISTSAATYNLNDANNNPNAYWWSHGGVTTISAQTGTVSLSDSLAQPANWSNANGHFASDPAYTAAFDAAVANVRQIGLSYGGGCFFDVGIAVHANTGTATFHLQDFHLKGP